MTYIRHLFPKIKNHIATRSQALILTGPRQSGKTRLLRHLFPKAIYFNCDDEPTRQIFNSYALSSYRQYIQDTGVMIIDEIQNLADPGRAGKLIVDQFPHLHLLITGSSGLTIKNKQSESMAGRAISYELLPLTLSEYLTQNEIPSCKLNYNIFSSFISTHHHLSLFPSLLDIPTLINRILVYGFYPALIGDPDPGLYLNNLVDRIILKDLLDLKLIENKNKALRLLTLLAYQIGQIISMNELANQTGLDQRTVSHYLTLFQESYLIYLLHPYSKRERDVLSKRPKVYFYDTGIRNALIGNYHNLDSRIDKGNLLENFFIIEAVKAVKYQNLDSKLYYWRTKQSSEVDLVIYHDNQLFANEFKWIGGKTNASFQKRYPHSFFHILNHDLITLAGTKSNF